MALLALKTPSRAANGTLLGAVAAAGGGDSFPNSGTEFFYVKNSDAAPHTVTFDSPGTCSFELAANAAHDLSAVIAAGEERILGPFPTGRFNDPNGLVQVSYSAATSMF